MNWLENLRLKTQKFMYGRYGMDQLSFAILIILLLVSLLAAFIHNIFLSLFSVVLLALFYFRVFSKKLAKRKKENMYFLKGWYPLKNGFTKTKNRLKGMKTHKYYKCPNCSQNLRVPKGKGSIRITCPKCKKEFSKRT